MARSLTVMDTSLGKTIRHFGGIVDGSGISAITGGPIEESSLDQKEKSSKNSSKNPD